MFCKYCSGEITSGGDWESDLDNNDYHRECFLSAVAAATMPMLHQTVDMVLMGIEEETRALELHAHEGGLFTVEGFSGANWIKAGPICNLEMASHIARNLPFQTRIVAVEAAHA